eukprot:3941942-Rhodomonas_salina.1
MLYCSPFAVVISVPRYKVTSPTPPTPENNDFVTSCAPLLHRSRVPPCSTFFIRLLSVRDPWLEAFRAVTRKETTQKDVEVEISACDRSDCSVFAVVDDKWRRWQPPHPAAPLRCKVLN